MQVGDFAVSAAGRDKGRCLAVLSVSDGYCLLADGGMRKCEKPKRKKIRHVTLTGERSEYLAERIKNKEPVTNSMLRKEISRYRQSLGVKEVESLG